MITVADQIKKHEGSGPKKNGRFMPYLDTKGKTTIGWGRNLTDTGITEPEAEMLLWSNIYESAEELAKTFDWFDDLDDVRRDVFIELHFNMGLSSLLTFEKMLTAASKSQWTVAARELLTSKWTKDVGAARSTLLATQLRTGKR